MHRRVLGALAFALAASGLAVSAAGASTPQGQVSPASFSSPVKVVGGQFEDISMVVDSTNAVDIAATGRGGLWFITNRGGSWSRTKVLADPTDKEWMKPSIAIDGNDHVYIALGRLNCTDCTPGGSDGVFLISDAGRAHGSFPAKASKITPGPTGDPSLKVVNGRIYLAYAAYCSCIPGDDAPLYLKTSTNGTTWTTSLIANGFVPQLRVLSTGRARVAYTRHDGLGFAEAGTVTGSFTSGKIPHTTGYDSYPLLAIDGDGGARIVYENGTNGYHVRYDRQTASGFGTPVTVTVGRRAFGFDLDTNQVPKVVQTGVNGVQLFTRNGSSWTTSTISSVSDAQTVVLRRAFNGKVDVAFARDSGGIWVTHG
jgi:hypothetical protein